MKATSSNSTPVLHSQQTKLGPCKGVPRHKIWIEGKPLTLAGFSVGARFDRTQAPGLITYTLNPEGKYKVSGKGDHPIIDLSGKIVPSTFAEPATHCQVTFRAGHITLSTIVAA